MELEVNDRGNLFVPSSRLVPMLQGTLISAAACYFLNRLIGVDLLLGAPSPMTVIGFLVLCVVAAHLILRIQADVEFDNSRRQVVKGKKVIVPYDHIRQIEIRTGEGDEVRFTILLRLRNSRIYVVLGTDDGTAASFDAAAIARAVGKEVELVE